MLDSELIGNVMVGIFTYKAFFGLIEFACVRLLATMLSKEKYNRYERMRRYKEANNPSGLQ